MSNQHRCRPFQPRRVRQPRRRASSRSILFNDPAILRIPGVFPDAAGPSAGSAAGRSRRRSAARSWGGKSPLLENTEAQARKTENGTGDLGDKPGNPIAMRYWHPMMRRSIGQAVDPDRTLRRFIPEKPPRPRRRRKWFQAAKSAGLAAAIIAIIRPTRFIKARRPISPAKVEMGLRQARGAVLQPWAAEEGRPGRRSVSRWQCERTAEAIVREPEHPVPLPVAIVSRKSAGLDSSFDRCGDRARVDGVPLVVVLDCFVSSIRKRWSRSRSNTAIWRTRRAFPFPSGPDGRRRRSLHPGIGPSDPSGAPW